MKTINPQAVKEYLETLDPTKKHKVYIGCDSSRYILKTKDGRKQAYADYVVAVVIHIGGNSGCKIFGEITTELDYDQKSSKPKNRMMNEAYKASEMFMRLQEVIRGHHIEIHLDINPNEKYGSSCAVSEAIGYIRGTCNVVPMVKPNAPVATYCSDWLLTHRSHL